MIVFNTFAVDKIFNIIPRDYTPNFTMSIVDDSTNIPVFYNIAGATTSVNFLNFSQNITAQLVEEHFYDIRLFVDYNFWQTNFLLWENDTSLWNEDRKGDVTIYRDRIFCTNQTIDQLEDDYYNINKNQYLTFDAINDNQYKVF